MFTISCDVSNRLTNISIYSTIKFQIRVLVFHILQKIVHIHFCEVELISLNSLISTTISKNTQLSQFQ